MAMTDNFLSSKTSPKTVSENFLVVDGVSIEYAQHKIVREVSFGLKRGEIGCLLGPSGCGKTTLLRAIAGFDKIASGGIRLGEEKLSGGKELIPPEQRNIGMVFQDYALFPHLSVLNNIAFGLHKTPTRKANKKASALLEQVGLGGKENTMPHQLSGGEQQRVALARALAPQPKLLLLDEPFSNLDVDLRENLSRDVREIIKQTNTTALMVTHDQHEAFAISDSIGVIHNGVLEQWGSSYSIYHQPINAFVANFVGQGVFLNGVIQARECVETTIGKLDYNPPLPLKTHLSTGSRVKVLIRPDDIIHDDNSSLVATVVSRHFRGADFLYILMLANGEKLLAFVPSHHDHTVGESIGIRLEINHVVVFQHED
tara:strand:+ start:185 stop:1297 length:1113 start_codon:yes stop_codon:yes gene_type:complete